MEQGAGCASKQDANNSECGKSDPLLGLPRILVSTTTSSHHARHLLTHMNKGGIRAGMGLGVGVGMGCRRGWWWWWDGDRH